MIAKFITALFSVFVMTTSVQAQTTEQPRPGYMLVMGLVTNREAIIPYARSLPPVYAKYNGGYLASGGPGNGVNVLEGNWQPRSIILAKFPTPDGPNIFWWSPEYRAAVPLRKDAGTFDVIKLKSFPGDVGPVEGKPAYLIGMVEVSNPDKIKEYGQKALPLVLAAGGRVIAGGPRKDIELLEGNFGNKTVTIVQFPSLEALRTFYNSPAYQAIIPIRLAGGDYTVLEVDGLAAAK